MIAIALACSPRLLIADEPITGLDTTTQKATMDFGEGTCSQAEWRRPPGDPS